MFLILNHVFDAPIFINNNFIVVDVFDAIVVADFTVVIAAVVNTVDVVC